MSIWIYGKNKDGKNTVTSISIPYELIIVLIGLIVSLIAPSIFSKDTHAITKESLYFMGIGFILFSIAKLSLFQKGVWISWGMHMMSLPFKLLYVFGYILMGIGAMIAIILYKTIA